MAEVPTETRKKKAEAFKRFNLTLMTEEEVRIVEEFKAVCKQLKRRYSGEVLNMMKDYVDDYKATR